MVFGYTSVRLVGLECVYNDNYRTDHLIHANLPIFHNEWIRYAQLNKRERCTVGRESVRHV